MRERESLPVGYDATDFVNDGATPEELQRLLTSGHPVPPPPKVAWTPTELLTTTFPEPRWAVPGLIPEGLTVLAGRPKLGKSWLALQMAQAKAIGGRVLDQTVPQGRVLYVALEDTPRRLQDRIASQGWPEGADDCTFLFECDAVTLERHLEHEKPALVVIDTLSRYWSAVGYDQNDVTHMTAAMADLHRKAAQDGLAIIGVDHHNQAAGKGDLDAVQDVLGSTGKVAVADCVAGLYRKRGEKDATLAVTGRDVEEREVGLRWDLHTCCWQLVPEGQGRNGTAEVMTVLQVADDGLTLSAVSKATGINKGSVSRILADLVNVARLVDFDGKRYRVAPPTGDADPFTGGYTCNERERGERESCRD